MIVLLSHVTCQAWLWFALHPTRTIWLTRKRSPPCSRSTACLQDFRGAVSRAARQTGKPVIEERLLNQILYSLPQLYELNQDLLKELELRVSQWYFVFIFSSAQQRYNLHIWLFYFVTPAGRSMLRLQIFSSRKGRIWRCTPRTSGSSTRMWLYWKSSAKETLRSAPWCESLR